MKIIENSRVVVTGGSGFIGTNLIDSLSLKSNQILSIDIAPPRNLNHKPIWERIDLCDESKLREAILSFRPNYVFHLGSRTDLQGSTIDQYEQNTDGVSNIIKATTDLNELDRIMFVSSRLVCRIGYIPDSDTDYCPSTIYGKSKVKGELLVRRFGETLPCPWLIVRPTSIWGPWFGSPYLEFFRAVQNGRYFHPGMAKIWKSFGYIGNTVHQIECLMTADRGSVQNRTFYLCDYPPLELVDWSRMIADAFDRRPPVHLPLALLRIAAIAGDFLKKLGLKEPPLTTFRLHNLLTDMLYDTTELEAICGDLPYSVEQGVAETVSWMAKVGTVNANNNSLSRQRPQ